MVGWWIPGLPWLAIGLSRPRTSGHSELQIRMTLGGSRSSCERHLCDSRPHCHPSGNTHFPHPSTIWRIFISHSTWPTCLTIQHMISGFLVFWFLPILVIRKTTGLWVPSAPPFLRSIKVSPFPWHSHILFGTTRPPNPPQTIFWSHAGQ